MSTSLVAQRVSKLRLEQSTDLQNWQVVPVTPEMIDANGELILAANSTQAFYRLGIPELQVLQIPIFTSQPTSSTAIEEEESATLSVNVTGEGLSYQWYYGETGKTSQPISGATSSSYITGPLMDNAIYWVRVQNAAGSKDSDTFSVIINRPPTITDQPTSQTITSGSTATMTVVANGTAPFTYQWYRGNVGSTTNPVGTDSAAFTTPPLTATTRYWVKVSNELGFTSSSLCTITVGAQTDSGFAPNEISGLTLTMTGSQTDEWGEFSWTETWEAENNGLKTGTIIGYVTTLYNGSDSSTYEYEVSYDYEKSSDNVGEISYTSRDADNESWQGVLILTFDSDIGGSYQDNGTSGSENEPYTYSGRFMLVRPPPSITTQPTSQLIASGSTATINVEARGAAPLTYQWYEGAVGTTTTPVGTNSSSYTTPILTEATSYWVRVSNISGEIASSLGLITILTTPTDMALIPAGNFTMGDSLDGSSDASPVTVNVSAFLMGKNEVTKALWDEVRTWGASNGYTDLAVGVGKAANHPVQTISWWDVVKWCNARSEKEGLTPVYTVSGAVMRTGTTAPVANWNANGYRLPTEAEWEKAARGGLSGKRFPWGDTISHSQANYYAFSEYSYDLSGAVNNYHPTYAAGGYPYTAPVGSFAANGYGLHDMAGNVFEWCWDWYGASTYVNGVTDPRGAASGTDRVCRGSNWYDNASYCRVADRRSDDPTDPFDDIGFRVARSSVP